MSEYEIGERPGYLGKKKDEYVVKWNELYGEGNWRFAWELASGEILDFEGIFRLYIESYVAYFWQHPEEADYLTENFSYAYDKEMVSREEAFDPYFLYDKPGHPNQFHNVALNIALEVVLVKPFRGNRPLQVREEKEGFQWSPGRIPAINPEQIPAIPFPGWWEEGSIEHEYQVTKVLQYKV